jgi:hypothetical protein
MPKKILVAAALSIAAATLAGVATAGPSAKPKLQRIAIVLDKAPGFVLTPLTSGPIRRDSGTWTACCWTQDIFTRDGQSTEIDDPTLTFKGTRGTFTWHARITFVDLDNHYTVATAVWTIVSGTGAYAHLEGHGRQAFVTRTNGNPTFADKAEGLMSLRP